MFGIGQDGLLRRVSLRQHACCSLFQDLMLGQLRSLLAKIGIKDASARAAVAFEIEDSLLIVYSRRL